MKENWFYCGTERLHDSSPTVVTIFYFICWVSGNQLHWAGNLLPTDFSGSRKCLARGTRQSNFHSREFSLSMIGGAVTGPKVGSFGPSNCRSIIVEVILGFDWRLLSLRSCRLVGKKPRILVLFNFLSPSIMAGFHEPWDWWCTEGRGQVNRYSNTRTNTWDTRPTVRIVPALGPSFVRLTITIINQPPWLPQGTSLLGHELADTIVTTSAGLARLRGTSATRRVSRPGGRGAAVDSVRTARGTRSHVWLSPSVTGPCWTSTHRLSLVAKLCTELSHELSPKLWTILVLKGCETRLGL